jgi:hypothetical protein
MIDYLLKFKVAGQKNVFNLLINGILGQWAILVTLLLNGRWT